MLETDLWGQISVLLLLLLLLRVLARGGSLLLLRVLARAASWVLGRKNSPRSARGGCVIAL